MCKRLIQHVSGNKEKQRTYVENVAKYKKSMTGIIRCARSLIRNEQRKHRNLLRKVNCFFLAGFCVKGTLKEMEDKRKSGICSCAPWLSFQPRGVS